jgi:Na+/H+-translocating membrane pyrophosphatase
MKKSTTRVVIVAVIIIAGIMGALMGYWMSESRSDRDYNPERMREIREREKDSAGTYTMIKSTVTMINIALASILIGLYFSIYREVKSEFTVSLIIVMFALLIYSITSSPILPLLFGFWGMGLGPFTMIPDLFATVALVTLLYISLK